MTTTTILSDNGVSSGSAGIKTTGGNDGTLVLQTTTSGGTATTAVSIDTSQNTTVAGNLTFSGSAKRITGDFSNATVANRVMFQTNAADATTAISAIPSGTGVASQYAAYSNSDPTNASVGIFANNNATVNLQSTVTGTGTYLPMTFLTSGSEKLRIAADTTGTYTFGGTAPRITGDFSNATYANNVSFQTSTANSLTMVGAIPNGTATAALFRTFNNSNTSNAHRATFGITSTFAYFDSGASGAGTYLPMTFYTGGSERMRIDANGSVSVGTTSTGGYKFAIKSGAKTQYFTTDATSSYYYTDGNFYFGAISTDSVVAITNNTERMRIDSSGNVLVTNPASLGYGTGSGGTVTQATNKGTTVTLNKPTGKITMNNAALAAGATASFTFNNSLLTVNDTIVFTFDAGLSSVQINYSIRSSSGAGAAYITIKNESAGSLSEAVPINFAIIKGATA